MNPFLQSIIRYRKLHLCLVPAALFFFAQGAARAAAVYGLSADRQVSNTAILTDGSPMLCGYSGTTAYSPVIVFQLPTLPAGKEFSAASLRLYYAIKTNIPTYNGDLYGLGVSVNSTVQPSDHYAGNLDPTVTLIQDNLVTPATAYGPLVSSVPTLTDYLNAAYDKGAGAGQYVFFRLSPDVAGLNAVNRYNLQSAEAANVDHRPLLYYSVVDTVQTTGGDLIVNGAIDVAGNTSTFGSQGSDPGLSLVYTPGSIASINFNASSSSASWNWRQGASLQLKLDNTNVLHLFDPETGTAGVALDPTGVSIFSTTVGSGVTTELLRLQSSGANAANTVQRLSGQGDVLNAYVDFKRFATEGPATGLSLGTAGGDVLTIRSSGAGDAGNVGIGIDTPAAKLHVNGTVQITGDMTLKNNAVIRVSPAGDLSMGAFQAGENPSN